MKIENLRCKLTPPLVQIAASVHKDMTPIVNHATRGFHFNVVYAFGLIPNGTLYASIELNKLVETFFFGELAEVLQDLGSSSVEGAPIGIRAEAVRIYMGWYVACELHMQSA